MTIFRLLFLMFFLIPFFCFSQKANEEEKKEILTNIFHSYEIKDYSFGKVFETKAREKYASIPLNKCRFLQINKNIAVMAFDIYLSSEKEDYINFNKYNIEIIDDFNYSTYIPADDIERFIQVVFFDTENKKYIGKPEGFPIENLNWVMDGMGDVAEIMEVDSFVTVNDLGFVYALYITSCVECLGGLKYFFAYRNGKFFSSEGIKDCIRDVYEEDDFIMIDFINNCYEYYYNDMKAEIISRQIIFLE